MTRTSLDPKPTGTPDDSTATLFPETAAGDLQDDADSIGSAKPSSSSVPWPGSTFIIRSISSGLVITLKGGQIVLAEPGSGGNSHWECVRRKGWYGFRDPGSGRFLGYDDKGRLCCSVERQRGWEYFQVNMTPEGSYVISTTHIVFVGVELWYVGLVKEKGVEKLAKIGDSVSDATLWEFLKV